MTAQDRLWQMDIIRRYAAGEISEIIGPATVQHDQEQRILGLRQVAQKTVSSLSARDRSFLAAYVRGVNASIKEQSAHLPLEFRILRYTPKPWRVMRANSSLRVCAWWVDVAVRRPTTSV